MDFEVGWDVLGPAPEPSWQERLDRLFPRDSGLQWLYLYWEPGYKWHPIERWMIATVYPKGFVPGWIDRSWLDGPNPGTLGYWDDRKGKWVSKAPPISRRQWRLWRELGSFTEPYWVVQGSVGGHRYRWNRMEKVISRVNGGPADVPIPGELPFATPDNRTFAALAEKDRVRMGLATLDFVRRGGKLATEDERALVERTRQEVWDWLSEQAEDWGRHAASHSLKPLWENGQRSREADMRIGREAERVERQFMEEGVV